MTKVDRALNLHQVAEIYGCSVATIWRRVASGEIPRPSKLGGTTRWWQSEILAHIEELKAGRDE